MRGRDIICLSTHYWDERWFRKQEFMSRFALQNQVLFVEPSFSMARKPEAFLNGIASNRHLRPRLEARGDRLHLLKPPRGLPKWSEPRIERLNYRWYAGVVARAAARLGFRNSILWVYRPAFAHGLSAIPHSQLVFDLVDDLAAYGGENNPLAAHVDGLVTTLARRSDLLVVTAKTLERHYGPLAQAVTQVPNGFRADIFVSDGTRPAPPQLEGIPRPILGFVGTLFPFLDFELMEEVARAHHDKSVVLVGPVEASAEEAVSRLSELPNVFHLGRQPQQSMPAFIERFDVCLNPFRRSRVADSVNPLKVYEYLALGKPVVSTPMEALRLEDAGRMVAFAEGPGDFARQIEACLREDSPAAADERRQAALAYSWERLFRELDARCDEILALDPAAEPAIP